MMRQRTVDAPLPLFWQRPIPISITHLTADLTELIYPSVTSLQSTTKYLNLMSDNSKILMIRHLKRVVPRSEALLFNRKKLHQLNRSLSGTCPKMPPRASDAVASPDLVSYSIKFFTRKQRMILKKKMKEISKWNTALYSPRTGVVKKNYLWELRSLQEPSDKVECSIILHLSGPVQVILTEFCYGILYPFYQIRFNMTFTSIHKLIM